MSVFYVNIIVGVSSYQDEFLCTKDENSHLYYFDVVCNLEFGLEVSALIS